MMFMGLGTVVLFGILASNVAAQTDCPSELTAECNEPSACRTAKCSNTRLGTQKFKKAILDMHNEKRKLPFTNGSFGADMVKLEWDSQLEKAAQNWAHELCIRDSFEHDSNECRRTMKYNTVGQNLFTGWGKKYGDEVLSAREAVDGWYEEIKYMSPETMFPFKWVSPAGHYTQLVWSRSYRVGCAFVRKNDATYTYQVFINCNYAPAGNIRGAGYNVFDPSNQLASNCRPGSKKGSSGLCEVTDEKVYRRSVGVKSMKQKRR